MVSTCAEGGRCESPTGRRADTAAAASPSGAYLVDVVLLAQRVEHDVDLVEHVHHLHGRDVDADLVELDHVAEEDGHIWEDLETQRNSEYTDSVFAQ